jgi:type II secretory ATPase GspE/PulE/Tfp pilus assembly ATPase PilB-like protein
MVGEIRDQETAEVAMRAALTGHMVLSTVHANDASTTVTRLLDMGIPPFLVGSSIIMVVAQRLVRKLCDHCKTPYKPDEAIIDKYDLDKNKKLYKAKGCNRCNEGYYGRTGIFEILPVKKSTRKMVYRNIDAEDIRDHIRKKGIISMRKNGINKVIDGITSFEEVFSITLDED